MKNYSFLIFTAFLSIFLFSCDQKASDDLSTMKASLKEKSTALKALKTEVKSLEEAIAKIEPAKKKSISLVTLDTIAKMNLERYAELQASVLSDEMVNASSETGGRLISVTVKEGDYVRKGQLIARVDTDILNKQMNEINTRLTLATTVFEKQKRLWDQNIGSEIQYLQAKNNKESIQKSVETLNAQLAKANVYAPVSGSIDMEYLKSGEMASPGMPIVSILNTNKLKVVADVPENYLTKVKKGDKVTINFPAIDDKDITRRITLVGRSIDPSNRTFKIEMATDNLKGLLKPNLLAQVSINDLTLKDAVAIPIEIIQEEVGGEKYVFVAEQKGQEQIAAKKYVKTGESADGMIEITEGLADGDVIVKLGARTITEGDLIIDENAK